ncbi:MAG: hypothetical protein HY899_05470 [Deltaproteobacteria bacterium]|nr:hypothetical protein [Deltaproteobacteria bacterium]
MAGAGRPFHARYDAIEKRRHDYFPGLGNGGGSAPQAGRAGIATRSPSHDAALITNRWKRYAGDHEPWRDPPFSRSCLPFIPPEPFRWVGYQIITRLTGRSPRRR